MKNFLTSQIKLNDISVLLLLYKTSKSVLKNLKNYKDFKVYILDQSNDHQLKKKKEFKLHLLKKSLNNIKSLKSLKKSSTTFRWCVVGKCSFLVF